MDYLCHDCHMVFSGNDREVKNLDGWYKFQICPNCEGKKTTKA